MEALACLKLSTVLANHGEIAEASSVAAEGLRLRTGRRAGDSAPPPWKSNDHVDMDGGIA